MDVRKFWVFILLLWDLFVFLELLDYQVFTELFKIFLSKDSVWNWTLASAAYDIILHWNHVLYQTVLEVHHVLFHESVNVKKECVLVKIALLLGYVQVFTLRISGMSFFHNIVIIWYFVIYHHGLRFHRHKSISRLHCQGWKTFRLQIQISGGHLLSSHSWWGLIIETTSLTLGIVPSLPFLSANKFIPVNWGYLDRSLLRWWLPQSLCFGIQIRSKHTQNICFNIFQQLCSDIWSLFFDEFVYSLDFLLRGKWGLHLYLLDEFIVFLNSLYWRTIKSHREERINHV